jgi:hypothetical protein
LDAYFICVLVSDPAEHAGAWFYPASDITLISDANSWGVYLAHELGHLIADLGEEYPCYSCFRSGNYPASDDWNRTFDPDNDEPVDSPNLATDLNATPWEISPYIYETPTEDIPTSNLNAYRGKMVGAWQGGGTYRHGVWRSEEYCIMDTMMNHWNEFFCEVCESAIENELSACFATTPSDCLYITAEGFPFMSHEGLLSGNLDLPSEGALSYFDRRVGYQLDMLIPPFWKLPQEILDAGTSPIPPELPLPEPIPLFDIPASLTFRNLPAGAVVMVFDENDILQAHETVASAGRTALRFQADTLGSYRVSIRVGAPSQATRISVELTVLGIQMPLR